MKVKISIFFVILLIIFSGCTTVKKSEIYPPDNKVIKRIAIIYHGTEFRNEITDSLTQKLKTKGIFLTIDDAVHINNYDPKKWDLIVVFQGIHAFITDSYPALYLNKYKKEKNIIKVFYTFLSKKGVTVKSGNDNKVDSITAASVKNNQSDLIDNIYKMIIDKLGIQ